MFLDTSCECIKVVERLLVATVPTIVGSNWNERKSGTVELVTSNVGLLVEVTDGTLFGFSSLE